MKKVNKKYMMIVTAEDERYGNGYDLGFFADHPWEGNLNDIVYGDNLDELMISSDGEDNEGLFYVLYAMETNAMGISTGRKIGMGTVDWSAIEEEIREYELQKD